jgi:sugar/nucleoside kinase (ribokinase family)
MGWTVAVERYDVLIPGHYFCDIIFTGIPGFPALGTELFAKGLAVVPGGVMNTVVGLTRLGVHVGWLSTLGDDFFSRFAAETARAEGVELSNILFIKSPLKRVTVAMSYPQDRAFLTYVDQPPDLIPRIFRALENTPFRHLHFTGLQIDTRIPDLIRACHDKGITVSMDCQHREQTLAEPLVQSIVSSLDLFLPNAAEAQRLTQTATLGEAVSVLRDLVPYLVIKDGQHGAHAWIDGRDFHMPAIEVVPVDTTGAGDIFNAGFLTAWLQNKLPPECLRWGNIAGGLSLRGYGGYSTSPTLAELHAFL